MMLFFRDHLAVSLNRPLVKLLRSNWRDRARASLESFMGE